MQETEKGFTVLGDAYDEWGEKSFRLTPAEAKQFGIACRFTFDLYGHKAEAPSHEGPGI